MGFNSAFKDLKLLKPRKRAFKQFKWLRPQCVNTFYSSLLSSVYNNWHYTRFSKRKYKSCERRREYTHCHHITSLLTVCVQWAADFKMSMDTKISGPQTAQFLFTGILKGNVYSNDHQKLEELQLNLQLR